MKNIFYSSRLLKLKSTICIIMIYFSSTALAFDAKTSASGNERTVCAGVGDPLVSDGPKLISSLIDDNVANGFANLISTTAYQDRETSRMWMNFCITSRK